MALAARSPNSHALARSPNTPKQLTLLKSPSREMPVERSLAEVIDEAFHPEARRRLVASLKRREHDHALDIETQRSLMERSKAEALADAEAKLLRAEECHNNVLSQFANYKRNMMEDTARADRMKAHETEAREEEIKTTWMSRLAAERREREADAAKALEAQQELQR